MQAKDRTEKLPKLSEVGSLSVVIPTYNESKRLPSTLRAVHAFLNENAGEFDILIVDDGSEDNTVELARKMANELSHINVIANKKNSGKGAVVRQGLGLVKGDHRVFIDADHSTNINELLLLPGLIRGGGEVFISSRYLPRSKVLVRQPFSRVAIGKLANWIIRIFAVPGIKDTQNGFKIFNANVFEAIEPYLSLNGWMFDVEMLHLARKFGFKIVEFPIVWRNQLDSRLSFGKDAGKTAFEFLTFLKNRITGKYSDN